MGSFSSTAKVLNTTISRHLYSNKLITVHPRGTHRIYAPTALRNFGLTVRCCERPSTTKVGRIGQDRFKEGVLPGTYWKAKPDSELGEEVLLTFNKDSKKIRTSVRSGENLLRVAEHCGMMIPNTSFCFEGSCYLCEMEVIGGAREAGHQDSSDLVRSCLCPVPAGRSSIDINVFDDDGM